MEKLKLQIVGMDGNELIIRQGDALPLKEPKPYAFTGNLKSVRAYLAKHNDDVDAENWIDPALAAITVDRKNMCITLQTAPQDVYGTTIVGKLELSDELKGFSINTEKVDGREDFVKLMRFNGLYFKNRDVHGKVLAAVQKFTVKSNTEIGASNDNRGNRNASYNKVVDGDNIPKEFILSLPLFKGYEKVDINVELCFDVSESKVIFWLESVELAELLITKRDELLDAELKDLDATYVVMYA